MLYDVKNVQFDTEKIQETVAKSQVNPNLAMLAKGVPVGAIISLATVRMPITEANVKVLEKGGLKPGAIVKFFNMHDNAAGCVVFNIVAEAGCVPCNDNEVKTDFVSLKRDVKSKYRLHKDYNILLDSVEIIKNAALNIEKSLGIGWSLQITSKYPLVDCWETMYSYMMTTMCFLEEAVVKNKKLASPVLVYEKAIDVVALNLIKIIKKGTDNEKTKFTGLCEGIAVEALASMEHNGQLCMLKILKDYLPCSSGMMAVMVGQEHTNIVSSKLFFDSTIENAKCTYYISHSMYSMDTLSSNLDDLYNDLDQPQDSDTDFGDVFGDADFEDFSDEDLNDLFSDINAVNNKDFKFDKSIQMKDRVNALHAANGLPMTTYHGDLKCSLPKVFTNNTFGRLFLPRGKDFSDSFKAKYI